MKLSEIETAEYEYDVSTRKQLSDRRSITPLWNSFWCRKRCVSSVNAQQQFQADDACGENHSDGVDESGIVDPPDSQRRSDLHQLSSLPTNQLWCLHVEFSFFSKKAQYVFLQNFKCWFDLNLSGY
jgi:hypothetical protein